MRITEFILRHLLVGVETKHKQGRNPGKGLQGSKVTNGGDIQLSNFEWEGRVGNDAGKHRVKSKQRNQ